MPRAYIVATIDVADPVAYEEYRRVAPGLIAAHGGRYLVRGGAVDVLEGDAVPGRVVILEFPDQEAARRFWDSPEYRAAAGLRHASSTSSLFLVEGYDEG
mgnify:CR=1 FL=1